MATIGELEVWFDFEPKLTDESEILCPSCDRWKMWDIYTFSPPHCEECNDCAALICWSCLTSIESYESKTLQTRNPNAKP